jgi:hypothetical protein
MYTSTGTTLRQRQLHIPGDRTGDQEHVGVTGRSNKMNAEAFNVVDRVIKGDDFEFASIARTCIHLSDGE